MLDMLEQSCCEIKTNMHEAHVPFSGTLQRLQEITEIRDRRLRFVAFGLRCKPIIFSHDHILADLEGNERNYTAVYIDVISARSTFYFAEPETITHILLKCM